MRNDNTNLQNALEENLLSEAKNHNIAIGLHRGGSSNCSYHREGNPIVTGQIGIQKANPKEPAERLIGVIDILYGNENIDEISESLYKNKEVLIRLSKYDYYNNSSHHIEDYVLDENDNLSDIASDIVNHFKLN